jgi:cyclopropane fatty-acyl-phospholipid synthase-like methyltransferase
MTSQPVRTWASAEAVAHWRQGAARRATVLHDATEQMLDAAGLRPGARVLDLAAGSGDQTILAARRIGPSGSVLAVDISASMLAAAEEAFRNAGLSNVETLVSDIDGSSGPPEGIKATGIQMVVDKDQRTAVVVQYFDSAEDLRDSEAAFDAMDPSETPGTRASVDRGEVKLDLKM